MDLLLVNTGFISSEDYSVDLSAAAPGSGYDTKLDSRVALTIHRCITLQGGRNYSRSSFWIQKDSTQKTNFEIKFKNILIWVTAGLKQRSLPQKLYCLRNNEHNAGLAMDICSLDEALKTLRNLSGSRSMRQITALF
jgi:hypothetical protein